MDAAGSTGRSHEAASRALLASDVAVRCREYGIARAMRRVSAMWETYRTHPGVAGPRRFPGSGGEAHSYHTKNF